jgi:hypothetical protein
MAVIVDVGLAQVLVLGVLVWQMRMGDGGVVVLVRVDRSQVLPFADQLVRPLPPVVSHVRMLVGMHSSFMRVLDILGDMSPLANFIEQPARRRQSASRQQNQKSYEAGGECP